MKKGDIITVMTLAGEFVGKFESDDNGLEPVSYTHLTLPTKA